MKSDDVEERDKSDEEEHQPHYRSRLRRQMACGEEDGHGMNLPCGLQDLDKTGGKLQTLLFLLYRSDCSGLLLLFHRLLLHCLPQEMLDSTE